MKHRDVDNILNRDGLNIIPKPKELPIVIRFMLCFLSGFSPLLWVAFILVFLSYKLFGGNIVNLDLSIALLLVIFISGIYNFYQEVVSTSAVRVFKELLPPNCIVIRDGQSTVISSTQLVVGDLVQLESGTRVPADIRIISSSSLKLDKSLLTGENQPVELIGEQLDVAVPLLEARNIGKLVAIRIFVDMSYCYDIV